MREIKFRAFDKLSKKMFDVYSFNYFSVEVITNSQEGIYADTKSILRQDCILMQYTGLKDCDDKEIYEGDIVEGYVDIFSTDFAGNDRHGKTLKKGYVYYDLETPSFNINFDDSIAFLNEFENIKIIGNIYENKEFGV